MAKRKGTYWTREERRKKERKTERANLRLTPSQKRFLIKNKIGPQEVMDWALWKMKKKNKT